MTEIVPSDNLSIDCSSRCFDTYYTKGRGRALELNAVFCQIAKCLGSISPRLNALNVHHTGTHNHVYTIGMLSKKFARFISIAYW